MPHITSDDWPDDERNSWKFTLHPTRTRAIVGFALRQLFRPFAEFQAQGINHIPLQGPVLLASNHMTNFDVILMEFVLPRSIYYMAKVEMFSNPLMSWIYRNFGGFPVRRGKKDAWATRYARYVLENDELLGMFPEGSRSKQARLRPGKTGAARLALETGAPILPMSIYGTENLFKPWYKRQSIFINFGEPFQAKPGEGPMELTDRIMYAIADLLPPKYRGVYRDPIPT